MEWHNSVQSTNQISLSCNVNTLILMFISISIVPAKTPRMFIVNFSFRVTGLKFKWSNYVMTGLALVLVSPAAGTVGRWWGTSSLGGPRTGWVSQWESRGVTWSEFTKQATWAHWRELCYSGGTPQKWRSLASSRRRQTVGNGSTAGTHNIPV